MSLSSGTPGTIPFETTPSPLTVAVEQGNATFQCQHPLADVISWRVNKIPLNVATLQNVSVSSASAPNGVASTLSIGTLLVYNGIVIECEAMLNRSSPQVTAPVALRIQGMILIVHMNNIPTVTDHCRHPQTN